jgi:hypothetical protein
MQKILRSYHFHVKTLACYRNEIFYITFKWNSMIVCKNIQTSFIHGCGELCNNCSTRDLFVYYKSY